MAIMSVSSKSIVIRKDFPGLGPKTNLVEPLFGLSPVVWESPNHLVLAGEARPTGSPNLFVIKTVLEI
jgi:hypothetical protein